jgi:hypothetical protein
MSKQKLVCTAELELPDDALDASKAQTALLEVWSQFKDAVPEGTVLTAHVVKSKPKTAKGADPVPAAAGQAGEIPGFLKRT